MPYGLIVNERLDARFAGRTVVHESRGWGERAEILLAFIERHVGREVIKKNNSAPYWIGEFENLGEENFEELVYAIDEMIDEINAIAPEGTYFGYHECGGCIGFWYTEEGDEHVYDM